MRQMQITFGNGIAIKNKFLFFGEAFKFCFGCRLPAAEAKFKRLTKKEKLVFNGNPIAERYLHLPHRNVACESLELDPFLPVVLVTGGSQGAQAINEAVYS